MKIERRPALQLGGHSNGDGADLLSAVDGATFHGDVRSLWNPEDYPDVGNLDHISPESYDHVSVSMFMGTIEWIYQEQLLAAIYSWIKPGGSISVEEQNLPYIVRHYTNRRWRKRFPLGEHPKAKSRDGTGVQNWVNFKLYSGGSPGDHRMSVLDKHLLKHLLKGAGFNKVGVASSTVLRATARRPAREKGGQSVDYID